MGIEENYSLFITNIQDWPTGFFLFSNTANWLFSPPHLPITPLARAISHIKLTSSSNVITGESKRFGSFPFHKTLWCLCFFRCFHRDKYARRWNGLCLKHIFFLTSYKYQLGYITVIRWPQNHVFVILKWLRNSLWKRQSTCRTTNYELNNKVQEININLACSRMFESLHWEWRELFVNK